MLASPVSVAPVEPIEEAPSPPADENLEGLLEEGLRTLLLEATRISVLEAPYGEPDLSRFVNPFPPEPPSDVGSVASTTRKWFKTAVFLILSSY